MASSHNAAPPPYPGLIGRADPSGLPFRPPMSDSQSGLPPPPPTAYGQAHASGDLGARFQAICAQYEIGADYAQKLRLLSDVDIVVVVDDSGSMSALTKMDENPFGPMQSRWDELKKSLFQIIDIALLFDQNGVDLHFLNRTGVDPQGRRVCLVLRNVTTRQTIEAAFAEPPSGFTPLARTIKNVFDEKHVAVKEKKLLCLICTDGEPTDERGNVDVDEFRRVLATRHPINKIFVSIMACSDDKAAIGYLNRLDRGIKNLDVVDDFVSERKEVLRRKPGGSYSLGDHIVKTLVGSLDSDMDRLDDTAGACCSIL